MGIFSKDKKIRTWLRFIIYGAGALVILVLASLVVGGILFLTGDFEYMTEMDDVYLTPMLMYTQIGITLITLIGLFGLSIVLRRFLDKNDRPLFSLGFDFKRAPLVYIWGFVLGLLLLAVGYSIQVIFGWVEPSYSGGWFQTPLFFVGTFAMFFFSALFEELLLRGYPTKIIDEAAPRVFAVAIPALLFGLMHLMNPGTTWLSTVNITLAGALLGLVYLKSGSIWLAAGLHFGWNFAQGPLFGLGVSGLNGYPTLLNGFPSGHWLWSGGDFGLEGSLVATIVEVAAIVILILIKRFPLIDLTKENDVNIV